MHRIIHLNDVIAADPAEVRRLRGALDLIATAPRPTTRDGLAVTLAMLQQIAGEALKERRA